MTTRTIGYGQTVECKPTEPGLLVAIVIGAPIGLALWAVIVSLIYWIW